MNTSQTIHLLSHSYGILAFLPTSSTITTTVASTMASPSTSFECGSSTVFCESSSNITMTVLLVLFVPFVLALGHQFFKTHTSKSVQTSTIPTKFCGNCRPSGHDNSSAICYDSTCLGSRVDSEGVYHCKSTNEDGCANCTLTNENFHPHGCLGDHFSNMPMCSDCGPSGHDGANICSRISCRGSRVDIAGIPHCGEYNASGTFCANCDPSEDEYDRNKCLHNLYSLIATCTDCKTGRDYWGIISQNCEDVVEICYRPSCTGSRIDENGRPYCAQWLRQGTFCENCDPNSSTWTQYGCHG